MIPTHIHTWYAVDTCHQVSPGTWAEGASFVVTYVLNVRCVVYVKGLGESYMTFDRSFLLLQYLLLLRLLRLIKIITGHTGIFSFVDFSTQRKFSGENSSLLKVHTARRIKRDF